MSDLDELKQLLFGAEKQALDSIAERVESRDVRASDIADVLPEAIHRSHSKDGELVESLTEPVGECLQQAFRDDPETYSDALYPVMGPAIRKSIMQALRGFAQQINAAVEHSITPKGLKWRWQAARAGIPFGEFVLQKTLLFRVEQAYLISRENGLLMGHVHHEASKIKDSDAVSAMFTAIQDFVKESFSPDRTGRLESADMGEFTLWAVHGPHALLVCVIRGVPPRSLRGDLSAILERVHFRYGDSIRNYKGDTSSVPEVEVELERCLNFQARQDDDTEESGKRRPSLPILLLLFAASVLLLWWGYASFSARQVHAAFESALAAEPGIYVPNVDRDGSRFVVRGLRDPLAADVADVAAGIGVHADEIVVSMQAFQSLEPEIVQRRVEAALDWPDGVAYSLSGSTLVVSGRARADWRRRLDTAYRVIPGIEALDASTLEIIDVVQAPPPPTEDVAALDGRRFYFAGGAQFVESDAAALTGYARRLAAVSATAADAGYRVAVTVTGMTDGSGSTELNAALAARRAAAARALLEAEGVTVDATRALPAPEATTGVDANWRRVEIDLELVDEKPGP